MTKPESACGNEDSFWLDGETSVIREEADAAPTYDLEERTARFGEAVIDFAKTIRQGKNGPHHQPIDRCGNKRRRKLYRGR